MLEEFTKNTEYRLESIEEDGNKFYFTAISLNNEFECEKEREILARESVGKPYIWRHQHPIQEGNEELHIFGKVLESGLDEKGEIRSKYEVYDHTPDHIALREDIRERSKIGDPLGISMRYRKYYVGDKILHYDVFEHSGTPYPKCSTCKTIDFKGENMTEPEIKKEDLDKSLKKIQELEETLNSRSKILEEMKTKVVTLENEVKIKEEALEDAKSSSKTLEEKVSDLKLEVEFLKKKPILDKILELKDLDEEEISFYKNQSIKYLEGKFEQFKGESVSSISVEEMNESAEIAKKKAEEELEKKQPDFEHFTKDIQDKIKKVSDK